MSQKKVFIGLLALTFIVYGQSLFGDFVFDDRGIHDHYGLLSNLGNLPDTLLNPYWSIEDKLYRPTTLVSYSFNIIFLGGSAFSFHLVNLLLYAGICFGLFLLIKQLFKNEWLAYLTGILFLVLPIHSEVVANITGRSELLTLLFSLLALLEFTKDKINFWLAGLWMFLAIGAKETAIATLPLILFVIWFKEKKINREVFEKYFRSVSATVIATLGYLTIRFLVLGSEYFSGSNAGPIENPLIEVGTIERIATAFGILWMYIQKSLVPLGLCSDYSYSQIATLSFMSPTALMGFVVYVGAIFTTIFYIKRKPVISFASAFFVSGFFLVSNIPFPIGTIAGERLFFYTSVGLVILLAVALSKLDKRAAIVIIAIFAALSFYRGYVWMTEERLFLNAAECSPRSVLSLSNAGTVYYFRGEYDKAAEYLEKSREIKPIYSKGLNNLGLVYWKEGRIDEARELYHDALRAEHPYGGAIENLILLYLSEGDEASALRWLRIAYPNVGDSSLRNLF